MLDGEGTVCLFRNIFDTDCPGCGMTRALHHAIRLEFSSAFELNSFIAIVFPLLTYLWMKYVRHYFREMKESLRFIISNAE